MLRMGFSRSDIHESLTKQRFNNLTATYLLLGRRLNKSPPGWPTRASSIDPSSSAITNGKGSNGSLAAPYRRHSSVAATPIIPPGASSRGTSFRRTFGTSSTTSASAAASTQHHHHSGEAGAPIQLSHRIMPPSVAETFPAGSKLSSQVYSHADDKSADTYKQNSEYFFLKPFSIFRLSCHKLLYLTYFISNRLSFS